MTYLELKEIYPGILSCKNYLEKSELEYYAKTLADCPEETWFSHYDIEPGDINGKFLDGKLSLDIVKRSLHEKLINFFAIDHLWIYCHSNVLRLKTGEYSSLEDNNTERLIKYFPFIKNKIALYISKFSGGEIVFPEIDFEYKPEIGELLVIDIDKKLNHYTKPVTSGIRYVYMDYVIKHPGYYMP